MSEFSTQLVQFALVDVHASWFPAMDEALLMQAKASHYGRRWLASQLANIELFSVPPAALSISPALLQADAWWATSISENCAWFIELGAYKHISSIRHAIIREHVMQWRRVLGTTLYQRLLREDVRDQSEKMEIHDEDGFLFEWIDDDALAQRLKESAYSELLGFASRQHPLLAQRMALAFPEAWWQNAQRETPVSVLSQQIVTKILAR